MSVQIAYNEASMIAIGNGESDENMYESQSEYEYEEKENCEICEEVLVNHVYGNVCKKHIPSYALYDDDDMETDEVDMEGYITQEGMDDTDDEGYYSSE